MIKFPCTVLLRCKLKATITDATFTGQQLAGADSPNLNDVFICGTVERGYQKWFDMWRLDGKWRYSGEPHSDDIVGIEENGKLRPLTDEFKS